MTGHTYTQATSNSCKDSGGNAAGDPSSEFLCTGLTGNEFSASACDNNAAHNFDQSSCVSGAGLFTPSACRDKDGIVLVADGTGLAANETACEGMSTGNTFAAASVSMCRNASNVDVGDPSSESSCEGVSTGHNFTASTPNSTVYGYVYNSTEGGWCIPPCYNGTVNGVVNGTACDWQNPLPEVTCTAKTGPSDWADLGCAVAGKAGGNTVSALGAQRPSAGYASCVISCPTQHASCTDGLEGGTMAECTGLTGYSFTAAKCVGGSQPSDPYTVDSNGASCTLNGGAFTGSTCKNDDGVDIGDGSSLLLCEGADNGLGRTYSVATGELDFSVASVRNRCSAKNDAATWASLGCAVSGDQNGTNTTSLGAQSPVNATYHSCSISCPVDGGDFAIVSILAPVADGPEEYGSNRSQAAGHMVEDCVELLSLAGATVSPADGFTLTMVVPEEARAKAYRFSKFSPDNVSSVFTLKSGSFKDVSHNLGQQHTFVPFEYPGRTSTFPDWPLIVESEDTSKPALNAIGTTLRLETGELVLSLTESAQVSTATDVGNLLLDLSRIYLYDNALEVLDASFNLAGSDVKLDGNAFAVTIALTEQQRIAAVKRSKYGNSTFVGGGDGLFTSQFIKVDAGFMTDLAGNSNDEQTGVSVAEVLDETPPVAIGASIDYSTGKLTVRFSESIDLTPPENFEAGLHLFSIEGFPFAPISLAGATVAASMGGIDAPSVVIQLVDSQKAPAVVRSSTVGGDGPSPNVLVVRAGGLRDVSQVELVSPAQLPLVEAHDTVAPTVLKATFDYGSSELSIELSESADLTPVATKLNMSRIYLSNSPGSRDLPIAGNATYETQGLSTAPEIDAKTIVIKLPEPIRLESIFKSALVIGDGVAQTIVIDDGAIMDVAQNPLAPVSGFPLIELPDTTPPNVISAELDLGTGILVIRAQETIISTTVASSLVLTHMVFLENVTNSRLAYVGSGGTHGGNGPGSVDLTGATFKPDLSVFITVYLTEAQRVDAIRQSGLPGGDGIAQTLHVSGTPKICKSCSNNGDSTSELLCTGLNKNVFAASSCTNNTYDSDENACEAASGNFTPSTCKGSDGTVLASNGSGLAASQTACEGTPTGNMYSDGDGTSEATCSGITGYGFVASSCDNNAAHNADKAACEANSDPSSGTFTSNRCNDKEGNSLVADGSGISYSQSACEGNATGNTFYAATGVFFDLQLLPNSEAGSVAVAESPDEITPVIVSVSLDFSYGIMIFNSSESIDLLNVILGVMKTPVFNTSTNIIDYVGGVTGQPDLAGVFVSDDSGLRNISLHGAAVVPTSDPTRMTLQLTEAQRVAALRISSQPGLNTDGTACMADVNAGSLRDVALNPVLEQLGLNVTEIPDTVRPAPLYALLNLSSRTLEVTLTETADVYDGSTPLMDLTKIFLSNITGDKVISITGATVPTVDTFHIVIPLTRYQSATANTMSGVDGGDGKAMSLDVDADAFQDLVGLRNLAFTNVTVYEFPDLIPPTVINVTLDYSKGGSGCGFLRCALLTIEFSEFIREPLDFINASQVFLGNTSTSDEIRLDEAIFSGASGYNVLFTLTEPQRAVAITLSGTRGGDNSSIMLNVDAGFASDYGANEVPEQRGVFVYETPDTDIPSLENATLDLGTGVLQIIADETLDFTPVSAVVFENMSLANVTGDREIVLIGATVQPRDRAHIFMTVTEAQRVRAIQISGLTGGDGNGSFFETELGALRDVGLNLLPAIRGLPLIELPDYNPS